MGDSKHIVFVLKAVSNLSYHQSTISSLVEKGGRVTVLFPAQTPVELNVPVCNELKARLGDKLALKSVVGRQWGPRAALAVGFREMRSLGSYLRRKDQSRYYSERWRGHLLPWTTRLSKWFPTQTLLKIPAIDRLMRGFDRVLPADKRAVCELKSLAPDVVVASPANLAHSEEVEYLKAARELGVRSAVSVLSWDNLTTKGLIHGSPDLVLVWNERHRKQAIEIHGIAESRLRVTGSPFLDKWWEVKETDSDWAGFCARAGLDPSRPFLLYLGSSPSVETDELRQVRELQVAIAAHPDPFIRSLQILARPHPANGAAFRGTLPMDVVVWPGEGKLPDFRESLRDFWESVTFSAAAVGLNTTGMMDAVVMDHPCICWLREGNRKTQADAVHFQELLTSKAVLEASTAEGCLAHVLSLRQEGGAALKLNRAALVLDLVRPLGLSVSGGEAAARAIEEISVRLAPGLAETRLELAHSGSA